MATGKVIKLTNNNGTPLLPITDSAYVQHKWKEGAIGGTTITSVQDALNNVIDRVDALDTTDDDHAFHKVSGTKGKMNDTSSTAASNPYINVHQNTTEGSNASAIQLKGSSSSGAGSASVSVSGVPNTGVITITASYTDTQVTSAANHYKGNINAAGSYNLSASGGTATQGLSVITGVKLSYDAAGHISGLTITSGKTHSIPANNVTGNAAWTKASYLTATNANSGNVIKQSTLAIDDVATKEFVNSQISGLGHAMSWVDVSSTDPKGSSGATITDTSHVWKSGDVVGYNSKEYVLTGSTNAAANWRELGDESSFALANNVVNSITTTDDNTWIQSTPTSATKGAVTIDIQHIGPGSGTDRNATQKTDASRLSDTSKVIVGLSYTSDAKGHITKVSYTMAQLPDIPVITTKKTGSGNVVTYVSANNHEITYYMGITALTEHQAHQDHAFINKTEAATGDYELKLSKGSSGSGSSVYFTPSHGVKLTASGTNKLTIGGTSVNVVKTVSYTSGMYAVIGKDADINDTWLTNALGTTSGTTYMVNGVTSTNESVWDYT